MPKHFPRRKPLVTFFYFFFYFIFFGGVRRSICVSFPLTLSCPEPPRPVHQSFFMVLSLVWSVLQSPLPVNCRTCQLVIRPRHVPNNPNSWQKVCHCPHCARTYSTGWNWSKGDLLPHNSLQQVDPKYKLLSLGDLNARAGRGFELWKGVLGSQGIGNCNDSGHLHMEFCSWHQVVITTHCSSRTIGSRQHGDTHASKTGFSWTTS